MLTRHRAALARRSAFAVATQPSTISATLYSASAATSAAGVLVQSTNNSTQSALERVFGTDELIVHILLELSPAEIERAREVSRTWKETVDGAPQIQRTIFNRPQLPNGTEIYWTAGAFRFCPNTMFTTATNIWEDGDYGEKSSLMRIGRNKRVWRIDNMSVWYDRAATPPTHKLMVNVRFMNESINLDEDYVMAKFEPSIFLLERPAGHSSRSTINNFAASQNRAAIVGR